MAFKSLEEFDAYVNNLIEVRLKKMLDGIAEGKITIRGRSVRRTPVSLAPTPTDPKAQQPAPTDPKPTPLLDPDKPTPPPLDDDDPLLNINRLLGLE